MSALFELGQVNDINGNSFNLETLKDKVVLVVNVASFWGFVLLLLLTKVWQSPIILLLTNLHVSSQTSWYQPLRDIINAR